jgi:hypothetical protein
VAAASTHHDAIKLGNFDHQSPDAVAVREGEVSNISCAIPRHQMEDLWVSVNRISSSRSFKLRYGAGCVYLCVITCPAALDSASQSRWALGEPCVQRLCDPSFSQGGLRHRYVHHGSGPTGRAPEHHMYCGSGSCLPAGRALGCHANIKKRLTGLHVRLGPRVTNARVYVSKTADVGVIMGLQDVRTCGYSAAPALLSNCLAPLQY